MAVYEEVFKKELQRILDFWISLKDELYGGFFCRVDYTLEVDRTAPKSGIAAARNLWSFSRAYSLFGDKRYLECAQHAYSFLTSCFIDDAHGGVFWQADCSGKVTDSRKHVYLQAFSIYALAEYSLASGDSSALEQAVELWRLVEQKGYDPKRGCYLEEFSEDWQPAANELLSENGIIADITTNTHLHVLEAYTVLSIAAQSEEIHASLRKVIDIFSDKIYCREDRYQRVFFDGSWNEAIDLKSYGHDIEASWLLDEALKTLSIRDAEYDEMVTGLAAQTREKALLPDGSMVNECEDGRTDRTRIWWVQAEAAIGFYNAWQKTGLAEYLEAFEGIWKYIAENIIDFRPGGEWLYGRDEAGKPLEKDVVEGWKTPYHNSRCCMELYMRVKGLK